MRRQLLPALAMVLVFTVLTGVLYPLLTTGAGQLLFGDRANGSIIERDGEPVGSSLVGQPFGAACKPNQDRCTRPEYFHPRPSEAGDGYDGSASSGSNLGPSNPDLLTAIEQRAAAYRQLNGLAEDAPVPVDAVTGSSSGLDPHISVTNARLQAPRVAEARGVPVEVVRDLVDANTDQRDLRVLGEPGVNVLRLNLALDDRFPGEN